MLIDTHAHLEMAPFGKDRADVIARARDSGVGTIISVGIDLRSSRQAIELAETYAEVVAAVGFHPHNVAGVGERELTNLAQIAVHPQVVAIGELGLDFYRNYSPRATQLRVLERQLELAAKLDLPVIIHCRQAEKELIPVLHRWVSYHGGLRSQPRGVIHCFSGDIDSAQQYLGMGFFISFGAYIGYPASNNLHRVIRSIPQDRLVVETDSPFLPPQSHRGKRNEPAYLPQTTKLLAKIRQVPVKDITRQTTENARHLFRLPPV